MNEKIFTEEIVKETMIHQGYVSETCTKNGNVIRVLMDMSEDPCGGCNESRDVCSGRAAVSVDEWEATARIHIDVENKVLFPKLFGDRK